MIPTTRSECLQGPRPCPFISCQWHLWRLHKAVAPIVRRSNPDEAVDAVLAMPETCALDLSDKPHQYREIAEVLGVSHQAVFDVEQHARAKLAGRPAAKRILEAMG